MILLFKPAFALAIFFGGVLMGLSLCASEKGCGPRPTMSAPSPPQMQPIPLIPR